METEDEEIPVLDEAIGKIGKDKSGFKGRVIARRMHSPGREQLFLVPETRSAERRGRNVGYVKRLGRGGCASM